MTEDEQSLIQNARAIVLRDDTVLLIERRRDGRRYFVFPGGSLEAGETSEEAVIREVAEETGLVIRPTQVVATVTFPDRVQSFWLAQVTGGTFGTGHGPEMTGAAPPEHGTYQPVWLPIAELRQSTVYPAAIVDELAKRGSGSWPETHLTFTDSFMWWP